MHLCSKHVTPNQGSHGCNPSDSQSYHLPYLSRKTPPPPLPPSGSSHLDHNSSMIGYCCGYAGKLPEGEKGVGLGGGCDMLDRGRTGGAPLLANNPKVLCIAAPKQ